MIFRFESISDVSTGGIKSTALCKLLLPVPGKGASSACSKGSLLSGKALFASTGLFSKLIASLRSKTFGLVKLIWGLFNSINEKSSFKFN